MVQSKRRWIEFWRNKCSTKCYTRKKNFLWKELTEEKKQKNEPKETWYAEKEVETEKSRVYRQSIIHIFQMEPEYTQRTLFILAPNISISQLNAYESQRTNERKVKKTQKQRRFASRQIKYCKWKIRKRKKNRSLRPSLSATAVAVRITRTAMRTIYRTHTQRVAFCSRRQKAMYRRVKSGHSVCFLRS